MSLGHARRSAHRSGIRIATMCCLAGSMTAVQAQPMRPATLPAERPDMPAVNPRSAPIPTGGSIIRVNSAFANWSHSHHEPRILLFWNVRFDDEASTVTEQQTSGHSVTTAVPGQVAKEFEVTSGERRVTGGRQSLLDRDEEEQLETAFADGFLAAGANLVDRAATMRKASVDRNRSDRIDQQFMETLAVEQQADYLVEVVPRYDTKSPTNLTFSVKIIHVPSSRVRAQFLSSGMPEAAPERLVARPGGYVRERADRRTPDNIAQALASQTLMALAGIF